MFRLKIIIFVLLCSPLLQIGTEGKAFAQTGIISSLAGTGNGGPSTAGFSGDGGPAVFAKLNNPTGVLVDDTGNIYIADTYNYRIRKINVNGIINSIAGCSCGTTATNGALAVNVDFASGVLAIDKKGNLYVNDYYGYKIYKIDTQGKIYIIAGTGTQGYSGDEGLATQAQINYVDGLAFDKQGNLYVADAENYVIRKIDTSGIIHTIAGTGSPGYSGDGGAAINATFKGISSITIDTNTANLYISDINGNIRLINPQGIISTYIGRAYTLDSPDTIARDSCGLWNPVGLSLDSLGRLYYVDQMTARIKQVRKNDTVYTVAGVYPYGPGYNGDNIPATQAYIGHAGGTYIDKRGNLYIADTDNNRIRKVTDIMATGIKQVAGSNMEQAMVYPNPARNSIQITVGNEQIKGLILYNVLGKQVINEPITVKTNITQIDVSDLPDGIYFISIQIKENASTQKIIIRH